MPAAAGAYRQRITIEVRTETQSGTTGEFSEAWASVRAALERIPATVMPLQGRELERAQAIAPRVTHDIRLRFWRAYREDLTAETRIVYHDGISDRTFEILAPPMDVDEAHRELVFRCAEAR